MSELRYERLADDVAGMIAGGVLRAGERLPSVRLVSTRSSQPYVLAIERLSISPRQIEKAAPTEGLEATLAGPGQAAQEDPGLETLDGFGLSHADRPVWVPVFEVPRGRSRG